MLFRILAGSLLALALVLRSSARFAPIAPIVVDAFAFPNSSPPPASPGTTWRGSLSRAAARGEGDDRDSSKRKPLAGNGATTPPNLVWNLTELLSDSEGKLHPLTKVYNAAVAARQQRDPNAERSQSLPYTGSLNPGVAPYRMFVRKYGRDRGHSGRFSVLTEDADAAVVSDSNNQEEYGGSMQADAVFSADDPLTFIREHLSYHGDEQIDPTTSTSSSLGSSSSADVDAGHYDSNHPHTEVVVFCPGPCTFHESHPQTTGERTAPDRLKYYSRVLDGLPLAQLHVGTFREGQGEDHIDVELSEHTIRSLRYCDLLFEDEAHGAGQQRNKNAQGRSSSGRTAHAEAAQHTDRWRLRSADLDVISAVLARTGAATLRVPERNDHDEPFQQALLKLIGTAVGNIQKQRRQRIHLDHQTKQQSWPPHLVLMAYSTTSNFVAAALAEWKQQATGIAPTKMGTDNGSGENRGKNRRNRGGESRRHHARPVLLSESDAERLLHEAVTVVTVGALGRGFADGPAYVHVSMRDDRLAARGQ